MNTCRSLLMSVTMYWGTSPISLHRERQPLLVGADAEHHLQVFEQGGQVERRGFSVVRPPSILDISRMSLISASRCSPLRLMVPRYWHCRAVRSWSRSIELGEPEDGVHRGADLVAHVGQERLLFGAVGLLERLLVPLAFGDVAGGGEHPCSLRSRSWKVVAL